MNNTNIHLIVGADKDGHPVTLNERELSTHGLVLGSDDTGKTDIIKGLASNMLNLGWDGIILDLDAKATSDGLGDWCVQYSTLHNVPFQQCDFNDPRPSYWLSLLEGVGPEGAVKTILSYTDFQTGYQSALNEHHLGQLIKLMYVAHKLEPMNYPLPSIYDIAKVLSAADLTEAVSGMLGLLVGAGQEYENLDFSTLTSPSKDMIKYARSMGADLMAICETDAARKLMRPKTEAEQLDVLASGVTYVGLNAIKAPEVSRLASASVLTRMTAYATERVHTRLDLTKPRFIIVNAANRVPGKFLLELLSCARSASITVFLCADDPAAWHSGIPIGSTGLGVLISNTNIAMIMRQEEEGAAELCTKIVHGVVEADTFNLLEAGQMILRVKSSQRISWAQITPTNPALPQLSMVQR